MRLFSRFFVLLVLSLSIEAHAIEFDIWRTGMNLSEIVAVAKANNIPIFANMVITGSKGFDPRFLNDSFYKSSVFSYNTELLGKRCAVKLRTTDEQPKWLYEIEVSFVGAMQDKGFYEELLKLLTIKYGRPGTQRETIYLHKLWKPDPKGEVVLKWFSHPILLYIDSDVKEMAVTQRSYKYQDKKEGFVKKDADKF